MLDLGNGRKLRFFEWHPDDLPENRARLGLKASGPMPRIERAGALIEHPTGSGETCTSAVHFDLPEVVEKLKPASVWEVESWEPLPLSPSILCRLCGDHGFVRGGKWVKG